MSVSCKMHRHIARESQCNTRAISKTLRMPDRTTRPIETFEQLSEKIYRISSTKRRSVY